MIDRGGSGGWKKELLVLDMVEEVRGRWRKVEENLRGVDVEMEM